ncbi:hypothetical protein D0C36_17230 [Mucilaginibacter conchicola]|uniref:Lipocalin-like domain-containing protein n=1 Tax=Mucilaginibacter conchicola TaxID=2303333 RepID=A0A372NR15_9SPHI|nr:hypothetical protein [Mucilaginibacter conchicola]RFZ90703.1 hypothetical protein D0C36_17230 [Mucilaginibacter conchicola]
MKSKILKTLVAAAFITFGATQITFAQCDKTVMLTSSETSFLDDKGEVTRTKAEDVKVTITPTDITIEPGDDPQMSGKITSKTCDWKVPYKEGKTVIKSTISGQGDDKHITVTIEGKGGKVTLLFEAEEMKGKKIQVVADKFE